MILLQDGTYSEDNRLTRTIRFDEKSREHPVRPEIVNTEERSHTWRCPVYLDQGTEGACTGFGLAHALSAEPVQTPGLNDAFAHGLYWEAQKMYEGSSVLAALDVGKKMGWYDGYVWAFGFRDLLLGVSNFGPAVIGINWYEGMLEPDAGDMIYARGKIIGGHCTLVNGVNLQLQAFRIHNSWGKEWGLDGGCWISFFDMYHLLQAEGEAAFLVNQKVEVEK